MTPPLFTAVGLALLSLSATANATCPKNLSGTYSGYEQSLGFGSFNADLGKGVIYADVGIVVVNFDGKGSKSTPGSATAKSWSVEVWGTADKAEAGSITYTFDNTTCVGLINAETKLRYTITDGGNQLFAIKASDFDGPIGDAAIYVLRRQ